PFSTKGNAVLRRPGFGGFGRYHRPQELECAAARLPRDDPAVPGHKQDQHAEANADGKDGATFHRCLEQGLPLTTQGFRTSAIVFGASARNRHEPSRSSRCTCPAWSSGTVNSSSAVSPGRPLSR